MIGIDDVRLLGVVDDLDVRAADAFLRLTAENDELVRVTAALAVRATRAGHVCLDLARTADVGLVDRDERRAGVDLPPIAAWRECLVASPTLGDGRDPAAATPLVLNADRVYLDRYWRYEQRVAARLRALSAPIDDPVVAAADVDVGASTDPEQRAAVHAALTARLTVLTGGPGTGKTTTLVHLLAALLQADPAGRVALAAPTGKAAARMTAAIRDHLAARPDDLPQADFAATTLHRLFGYQPGAPTRFRHDADHPLDADVVVVDEASMVSLPLMAKLLDALAPDARLVLVGDRDQLVSVDAGAVLADLGGRPRDDDVADAPSVVASRIIELRRNYRFSADSDLGRVATRIRDGQRANEILAEVPRVSPGDVAAHSICRVASDPTAPAHMPADVFAAVVTHFAGIARRAQQGDDAAALLAELDTLGVLAALRRGPAGVERCNDAIRTAIARTLGVAPGARQRFAVGTPVLVTRNDHGQGLFNGDVGIVVRAGARDVVAFPDAEAGVRYVPVVRIAHLDPVYALSVHKSQGSQYERVVVALGAWDSPLLTRELVYTAITRARAQVTVIAEDGTLTRALDRRVQRASGLRSLLAVDTGDETAASVD